MHRNTMSSMTEKTPSNRRAWTTLWRKALWELPLPSPLNHMINTGTVVMATIITDGACSNYLVLTGFFKPRRRSFLISLQNDRFHAFLRFDTKISLSLSLSDYFKNTMMMIESHDNNNTWNVFWCWKSLLSLSLSLFEISDCQTKIFFLIELRERNWIFFIIAFI